MSKYSVKKPYTVLVAVVLVLVLGFVSFTKMTTDLLPSINLPYLVVVTTYPGASPEKVESSVTAPLESALGTVTGVENVTSTSAENYSMVMLEFEEDTNMDSAMVKVSSAVDQVSGQLPDLAGTPSIMEITPDMMATMYVSASYDGKDIYDLSSFAEDELLPYLERQSGVASVSTVGMVEKQVEVRLNQTKIDQVNDKMLVKVSSKLADAKQELDDAYQKLVDSQKDLTDGKNDLLDGQQELDDGKDELTDGAKKTYQTLVDSGYQLSALVEQLNERQSLQTEQQLLKAGQQATTLEMAIKGIAMAQRAPAAIQATAAQLVAQGVDAAEAADLAKDFCMGQLPESDERYNQAAAAYGAALAADSSINLQMSFDEALAVVSAMSAEDCAGNSAFQQVNGMMGGSLATGADLVNLYRTAAAAANAYGGDDAAMSARAQEIEQRLAVLNLTFQQVEAATGMSMEQIPELYKQIEAGKLQAAAGFGSGDAQLSYAQSQLDSAKDQLDSAQDQIDDGFDQLNDAYDSYEKSRKEALENANLDSLLNMSTLSGMITAQNFDMPAGYIKAGDGSDDQWLLRVGEDFESVDELEGILLCSIDGIGDVRLGDVATLTVIDNAGDAYAKVNGNDAVVLSIFKGSTAGTSEVSKTCNKAIAQLEEKYPGLHITPLMDQGDYIKLIVNSVLSNLIWGALLAVIVLAFFLKDVKPTIVVAFSIPFSVMVAIVLMYFSGVTLNMISLSGLALGVGMLVDNSVVVIENIYRLRGRGVPAARAAVQGAKQVTSAVTASTITTICVFLPMVFTSGLTRELLTDMALTIAYSLLASLIVALTVVPCMSVTVLKKSEQKGHPWFDKMLDGYERLLRQCLKHKAVPLVLAVALLGAAAWSATRMGMVMMPNVSGNQISVTVTMDEGVDKDTAYAKADEVMDRILAVDGVDTVGAMSASSAGGMLGSMGAAASDNYTDYSYYIMLSDEQSSRIDEIAQAITDSTRDMGCEVEVSTSGAMDMSSMMSSGMEVDLYGKDLDDLLSASEDVMDLLGQVEGFEEISNGQEDGDALIHLVIDRDAAMRQGLTVAQIYQELSAALTTETTSTSVSINGTDMDVVLVDEDDPLTLANLMDYDFKVSKTDEDDGSTYTEHHKLSEFATRQDGTSVASISRENQTRKMSVTATTADGHNTTLLSRQVETLLADYQAPDGVTVSIGGESTNVTDMMTQMVQMIALALLFVYLVMVAQFQNLIGPFIVIFTIPLAFTGGLLALSFTGTALSMVSMMGFLVLSGVVVNNGIVFVDYANQLWQGGLDKTTALVATGRTRMRPILMTALTTILAMCTMLFSNDAGSALGKDMALVIIGGLTYATLMTLFIVPVMYDIIFRHAPKVVDTGSDDLDDVPDDAAEYMEEMKRRQLPGSAADGV